MQWWIAAASCYPDATPSVASLLRNSAYSYLSASAGKIRAAACDG
jgi:hypothetical protein